MGIVGHLRFGLLIAIASLGLACEAGEPRVAISEHVLRELPRTQEALVAAHAAAADRACIEVPQDQPLETDHALASHPAGNAPWQRAERYGLLTLGMDMTPADRDRLPRLTRGMIIDRVDNNYLSIQAGVLRTADGTPYLLDRPLAAVGGYGDSESSQEFAALAQSSVRDLRSLGLFLEPDEPATPEHLRTLVLVHKSVHAHAGEDGNTLLAPGYEYMFIRARAEGPKVTIYGFATSGERTKLHFFGAYDQPKSVASCDICSTIFFTDFGFAGLKPTARATRHVEFRAASTYTMAQLDQFVAEQGWGGGALDHLTHVLDAIIDGRVR